MSISLRNATNETFGARGISGWGNNIGRLGGVNTINYSKLIQVINIPRYAY